MDDRPWVAFPSVSVGRADECAVRWRVMRYRVAVLLESPGVVPHADRVILNPEWRGFPQAANRLLREVDTDICVLAGDDIWPDLRLTGPMIAAQFRDHFVDLDGMMQPTGDRYGSIDTCAIAPWIGRGYCERMRWEVYHPGYWHYYSDAELCAAATLAGRYWTRPDLVQYHDHWERRGEPRPAHLQDALHHHARDGALFAARQAGGFACA